MSRSEVVANACRRDRAQIEAQIADVRANMRVLLLLGDVECVERQRATLDRLMDDWTVASD